MSQNSKARVAVVAAAALVGGLVPILAATGATAAAPTGISVAPVTQMVGAGATATLTAFPGETFGGRVIAVLPTTQTDSRTPAYRQ